MKYYEKIKDRRRKLKLTINDVYLKGLTILGLKKSISVSTIKRIESGKKVKFSSLDTLCFLLGIKINDLYKGTEQEDCLVMRKKDRKFSGGIVYNGKVHAYNINNPHQSLRSWIVVMQPKGEMPLDFAPKDENKHEKWILISKGELSLTVGTQKETLKSGDTISFDCTKPHYFQNNEKNICEFIMVENPGRY